MMFDKNGVELRTGCVVEITGAYFKNDNGFWFVEKAPGDPGWCGPNCCLKKISKTGKVSKAKHNICFWPIYVCVSNRFRAAEARSWNRDHAQIEVKTIQNTAGVATHFEGLAEVEDERITWEVRHFGEDHPEVARLRETKAHYLAVAKAAAGRGEGQ